MHADAIAIGGQHVTLDIARGLSTNLADAERLKARHGSALPSLSDDKDILTIPPVGEDERDHPNTVPRSALTRIIRPRVEETLEMARDMLAKSGFAEQVGQARRADRRRQPADRPRRDGAAHARANVRLGRPLGIAGTAGGGEEPGVRGGGRPHHLPAGGADRAVPRAQAGRGCR